MDQLTYTGDFLREKAFAGLDIYDPSPELVEAVNMAIILKQPLLLMGEPGSGKTRLAESVAAELHQDAYPQHYFRWDIKSTSKAKEGIYQYDALGRLYDANAGNDKARHIFPYISYGKLAQAIHTPQRDGVPNILLIDEIDKADIDFPNDLLMEIEKKELYIPELNKNVPVNSQVLFLITSNRERELPPAFLRRCLYHYISFPKKNDLTKIIALRFNTKSDEQLVDNAVELFLEIREKLDEQLAGNEKKPSTSELLEWYQVILYYRRLRDQQGVSPRIAAMLDIVENYQKGRLNTNEIPFRQTLLKTWESNQTVKL